MEIKGKRVLVTGGGSGIGLELTKAFIAAGAQVIITGRDQRKLELASTGLVNCGFEVCDITQDSDIKALAIKIAKEHGPMDILVNNAGISMGVSANLEAGYYERSKAEMETNFFGALGMISEFLPQLSKRAESAIVNIESALAYVPMIRSVTYSASKAALHSYSQGLRAMLKYSKSTVKVFEVFPPLVDTGLAAHINADKMSPVEVAKEVIDGILADQLDIRNGVTEFVYQSMLKSPEDAVAQLNQLS